MFAGSPLQRRIGGGTANAQAWGERRGEMMTTATIEQPRVNAGVTIWLSRIRAEYREMPGLSLTPAQMQRLFGVEPHVCEALIDSLVASHVLRRTFDGQFVSYAQE
jgi:hypothetical protein